MSEQQGKGVLGLLWVVSVELGAIVALLMRIAEMGMGAETILFLLLFIAAGLMYWAGRYGGQK